MQCPVCGAQNEEGSAFCFQCGSSLRPGTAPATGQTVLLGRETRDALAPQPQPAPDTRAYESPSPSAERAPRVYDVPSARPAPFDEGPSLPAAPVTPRPTPYVVGTAPIPTSQTSTMAVLSLVLGLLSWIFLPLIGAIGAIITGHMARREIGAANGRVGGAGLALAGLVLGYLNLFLAVMGCAIFALGFATFGL